MLSSCRSGGSKKKNEERMKGEYRKGEGGKEREKERKGKGRRER